MARAKIEWHLTVTDAYGYQQNVTIYTVFTNAGNTEDEIRTAFNALSLSDKLNPPANSGYTTSATAPASSGGWELVVKVTASVGGGIYVQQSYQGAVRKCFNQVASDRIDLELVAIDQTGTRARLRNKLHSPESMYFLNGRFINLDTYWFDMDEVYMVRWCIPTDRNNPSISYPSISTAQSVYFI